MTHPSWSGQLRISLVSFGIQLIPATETKSEIHFHQLNRRTGERVKFQKTSGEDGPAVEKDEIVKGYEYSEGKYAIIEPSDIENLRIPSREILEVEQFVNRDEVHPEYFERPYFVAPQDASQAEAFAVVRKAMQSTRKIALGKIAFGGREHLMAIAATEDDERLGMMAYTMRYAEELREPSQYFAEIKHVPIDEDQLSLATELIKRKTSRFDASKFKDEYEMALRTMVEAKLGQPSVLKSEAAPKFPKVVSLMDALRKSVQGGAHNNASRSTSNSRSSAARKSPGPGTGKDLAPVESAPKPSRAATKRKSA